MWDLKLSVLTGMKSFEIRVWLIRKLGNTFLNIFDMHLLMGCRLSNNEETLLLIQNVHYSWSRWPVKKESTFIFVIITEYNLNISKLI